MTQTFPKTLTFEEFADWLPESGVRYELRNGNIVEIAQPVGKHEEIKGFLGIEVSVEIKRLGFPYSIANQVIIKPPEKDSGYLPDVLVFNRASLVNEPLWKKLSTLSLGTSIPLVIEVVSTNWRDDYYFKSADYEEMGIPEYWIVEGLSGEFSSPACKPRDYAALGGRNFIGTPKRATICVCNLVDGEYQIAQFRENDQIVSQTFPELNLAANQIFEASA